MSAVIEEGKITGAIDSITLEKQEMITKQMKTCICKIFGEKYGTGFFCKMLYENKIIKVLMTNYHIISDDYLKKNKHINISINDGKKNYSIQINSSSKIFSSDSEKYDIMIIKLDEEKDFIDYLELDEHLFDKYSEEFYANQSIYILHYSKDKVSVSLGYGIQKIEKDEYYIKHLCNTEFCSSGSPILSLLTNKVIGIHKGCISSQDKKTLYNIGILLKYPLNQFFNDINDNPSKEDINKKKLMNEIIIVIKINKNDVNKNIYFLGNNDDEEKGNELSYDNLKIINDKNTEIFINDKKSEFCRYINQEKEGDYTIKLKFNNSIKDCSSMFHNCKNIIKIDLSNFDSENIYSMKSMFANCNNLVNIIFSSFNTQNVVNMACLFFGCNNLQSVDLSSFNTSKVTSMIKMFTYCKNLVNINLSFFDTTNVTNMEYMFYCCEKLKNLDLSKFNTKNVTNMRYMFFNCSSLVNIDLTSFDTTNVKNMGSMFKQCTNLVNADLSSFDTKNVTNMENMFDSLGNLKNIDLTSFTLKNVENMKGIFSGCNNLAKIKINEKSEIKIKECLKDDTIIEVLSE